MAIKGEEKMTKIIVANINFFCYLYYIFYENNRHVLLNGISSD